MNLTYDEAIASILAPWFKSEPPKPDIEAASPREAAGRALVACVNSGPEHGVVRVICPDKETVKAVKDYTEAFFEEKRLRPCSRAWWRMGRNWPVV